MKRRAFLRRFAIGCAFSGMLMDALERRSFLWHQALLDEFEVTTVHEITGTPRWTPHRLVSKSYVVDERLAEMWGIPMGEIK